MREPKQATDPWILAGLYLVLALLAVACSSQETLTQDEEEFCVLMSPDRADTFGGRAAADLSPKEFEEAQLGQTHVFLDARKVAPPELESTLEWIGGQFVAINAVWQDVDWDLSRVDDIDLELMGNVAINYPEETAIQMYDNVEDWTKQRC
jgi:hypothetical protein